MQTIETERDALIQIVTEAFSRGDMEMAAFEKAVTRLNICADRESLVAEASLLGLTLPVPATPAAVVPAAREGVVELSCVSGSLRKSGAWVKSGDYRLALKSSNARLDLREYEGARGFRLHVEVEAVSSNLRLIVPEGFEVEDHFSERVSSVVRNRPRDVGGDKLVILTGSLRSSTVRVKYR